jgi:hypothetical protein
MRLTRRRLGPIAVGLALVAVATSCGDEPNRQAAPASSTGSPQSTLAPPESSPPEPEAAPMEVACGPDQTAESRALVTAQELVFAGTVVRTTVERNPDSPWRTGFLDDGLEDPGAPPPDEAAIGNPDAGALWPWTTFAVDAWFTTDFGTQITIWTAGLDVDVGDRMLIAGEAFQTALPEDVGQSGMAVVCASAPYDAELDAEWQDWFDGTVVPGGNEPEGQADPAAVAEIEAAQKRWEQLEPATYSASLSMHRDAAVSGACPPIDPVLIVVQDGEVTSAVSAYRGCHIDPESATLPTIDDLFSDATRAQAAAGDHAYELDPTWGFPTSYYGYDRSVELDGGVSWFHPGATTTLAGDEVTEGLTAAKAKWDESAPHSYTFVLDRLCFCGEVGPYTITVVDDAPASITRANGRPVRGETRQYLPGTIDELFEMIEADAASAHVVVATFDDRSGHPVNVYVDSIANAVDDEVTYVVRDLRPTR